jgi:GntR family transcriptional regulator
MESKHDNSTGNDLSSPLYSQVQLKILQALEQGIWSFGDIIPSEVELAGLYGVSQGTIRKAIDELVGQNLLIRKQGSGTFVATHQEEQSKYRFLHIANQEGRFEESESKILLCTHQIAPISVAHELGLGAKDVVIHIRRLMNFQHKPVVLEDIWLPSPLFEGIHLDLLNSWRGTMYGLFESQYGIHMIRAHERICAVMANAITQEFLNISPETPVLEIFRVAYTYGDRPVEVRQAQCLTNEYHYFNDLT